MTVGRDGPFVLFRSAPEFGKIEFAVPHPVARQRAETVLGHVAAIMGVESFLVTLGTKMTTVRPTKP